MYERRRNSRYQAEQITVQRWIDLPASYAIKIAYTPLRIQNG